MTPDPNDDLTQSPHRTSRLVVKLTGVAVDSEQTSQGMTVAATAAATGLDVSLWLTGEAVWIAVPGRAEQVVLPHAAPLADLRDALLATGRVTVCTQCAARRALTAQDLVAGAEIRGAASFVEEIVAPHTTALVY